MMFFLRIVVFAWASSLASGASPFLANPPTDPRTLSQTSIPDCKVGDKFVIDADGTRQFHGNCTELKDCQRKCAGIASCTFNWWQGMGTCYTFNSNYLIVNLKEDEKKKETIVSGDEHCTTHVKSVLYSQCDSAWACKLGFKFVMDMDTTYHGKCIPMSQCKGKAGSGGFNWSPSDGTCYTHSTPYYEKITNDVVVSGDKRCTLDPCALNNIDLPQSGRIPVDWHETNYFSLGMPPMLSCPDQNIPITDYDMCGCASRSLNLEYRWSNGVNGFGICVAAYDFSTNSYSGMFVTRLDGMPTNNKTMLICRSD